jgi:hypothetical protein
MLWISWIGWKQRAAAGSSMEQAVYGIDSVFQAGLPPLMLTVYFLILKSSARANVRGLIYVLLFIPIHYYVAATRAHSTPEAYLPAMLVELICAIALIAFWKEKAEPAELRRVE